MKKTIIAFSMLVAIVGVGLLSAPATTHADFGISVGFGGGNWSGSVGYGSYYGSGGYGYSYSDPSSYYDYGYNSGYGYGSYSNYYPSYTYSPSYGSNYNYNNYSSYTYPSAGTGFGNYYGVEYGRKTCYRWYC